MTAPTPAQFHCFARTILSNLNQIARRRGVIDPALYPVLITALGQADCKCEKPHAEDALRLYAWRFATDVKFIDGFTISYQQGREALEHHFFGGGSLDDRRNNIITVIFDIENEDKDAPNYRPGWSLGRYRTTKEEQLLWAFAQELANYLFIRDEPEPAEAEFDFEQAELDLTRNDDEEAA